MTTLKIRMTILILMVVLVNKEIKLKEIHVNNDAGNNTMLDVVDDEEKHQSIKIDCFNPSVWHCHTLVI